MIQLIAFKLMPVTITIRLTEDDTAHDVSLDELKAGIACGEIGPKALVRDRVLTNDEWWTLDNLNIFHRHSPKPHSAGEKLRKKQEVAEQQKQAQQRSFAQLKAYMHGNLIEERFNLTPLSEVFKASDACGVTRLWVLPAFEPERAFTFAFSAQRIRIEAAQGRTSLWYSLPQVVSVNDVWTERAGPPFDPAQILRSNADVQLQDAPEPFTRWLSTVAATQRAPSCSTAALDGIGFRHQLFSSTESLAAEWSNPSAVEHAPQSTLIKAYHDLIEMAELGDFWKG